MRAIDTNVLVRLITRDDPQQTAAADNFVAKGAWVSLLALMETTWVLTSVYALSAKEVSRVIEMLLEHRDLVIQDSDVARAALELFRGRPALGFSDCLMLEVAKKAGNLPLGTFDRNLGKAEGCHKL